MPDLSTSGDGLRKEGGKEGLGCSGKGIGCPSQLLGEEGGAPHREGCQRVFLTAGIKEKE